MHKLEAQTFLIWVFAGVKSACSFRQRWNWMSASVCWPISSSTFPLRKKPCNRAEPQLQRHPEGRLLTTTKEKRYSVTFSLTSLGRVAQMRQQVSQQSALRQPASQVHISTLNLRPAEFVCQSVWMISVLWAAGLRPARQPHHQQMNVHEWVNVASCVNVL